MEIFEETKSTLKPLWADGGHRKNAKTIILNALAVTELTVREAQEVMDELDRLLLPDPEEENKQTNQGL